jgi:hypothetical protein
MRKSTAISFVFLACLATVLLAFAQDAGPQPSQISIDIRDYCDPTGEVARFQCCIHPWMRVTITPKDEKHIELP